MTLEPVAIVRTSRVDMEDDNWGGVLSEIILVDSLLPEALDGIESFSHLEIIFHFDRVSDEKIVRGARHPRGNCGWPSVGIFAQRGKNRPNRLGLTIVRLIERRKNRLIVLGLDAIDGTPVLDIKPVIREFLPREEITQPAWVAELMWNYWTDREENDPLSSS